MREQRTRSFRAIIENIDGDTLTQRLRVFCERWENVSFDTAKSWWHGKRTIPADKLLLYNAFGSLEDAVIALMER